MMNAILSPSLLSANFTCLGSEIEACQKAGITWLHLDVMDGAFVPNITFGMPLISSLRKATSLFFDVHLMIEAPERYINDFAKAGADLLVVHFETLRHAQRTLAMIRENGMKAGLALDPDTDIEGAQWLLPYMDMLLLMGVNPGFSGQKFIPETVAKLVKTSGYLAEKGFAGMPIQVDGGINAQNMAALVDAGASILVSGSAFFGQSDYRAAMESFEKALAECQPARGLASARSWTRGTCKA